MFEFDSLKKLQGDFNGAFSLDKLQDGDDWMDEENGNGNQEDDIDNVDGESSFQIQSTESPIIDVVKAEGAPKQDTSQPDVLSNNSSTEISSKVQQGITAASKVSNFFSLDTLQEDDDWMGPGIKGMGMHSDNFEAAPVGGYDDNDDSDRGEDDGMIPLSLHTPPTIPSRSIAEEALAATQASGSSSLHSLQDLPVDEEALEPCTTKEDKDPRQSGTWIRMEDTKKEHEKDLWLPKYDRGVEVKIVEAPWKPPSPLPVVNPFEHTNDPIPSNPYLSGLKLSEPMPMTREERELETNVLSEGERSPQEGGKHSWFRRTDRDSLKLMGDSLNSVTSSFFTNMGLHSSNNSSDTTAFLSESPNTSFGYDRLPQLSSAMRATRAKIDHFGLLIEKERGAVSPFVQDLMAGRIRLTAVNKFQITVIVVGMCLVYFYYSISDYFVLT